MFGCGDVYVCGVCMYMKHGDKAFGMGRWFVKDHRDAASFARVTGKVGDNEEYMAYLRLYKRPQ